MKQIKLGKTNISVPAIVLGCMRLGALDLKNSRKIYQYSFGTWY